MILNKNGQSGKHTVHQATVSHTLQSRLDVFKKTIKMDSYLICFSLYRQTTYNHIKHIDLSNWSMLWLFQNPMIFSRVTDSKFDDFSTNFKNFSQNSMIFLWSWNKSEFRWFFKSCRNPPGMFLKDVRCILSCAQFILYKLDSILISYTQAG